MSNIEKFKQELSALCEKYNASIVRSAADNHNLFIVVDNGNGGFDEEEFEEDINEPRIRLQGYKADQND